MPDGKSEVMTDAIALSQVLKDIYGKYLQFYDIRNKPELEKIPFPYVMDSVRDDFGFFKLFKDNLGSNTPENIKRFMDDFYKSYKKFCGKSPIEFEDKDRKVLRDRFARKLLNSKLDELKKTFSRDLLYPTNDTDSMHYLDSMYRLFLTPKIPNTTSFVVFDNVSFGTKTICKMANPTQNDIEDFHATNGNGRIEEHCFVQFPGWKSGWPKKIYINNNIFLLTAAERYSLVNIMCHQDTDLIRKFAKVWKRQPFDTEYRLWLCSNSRANHLQSTKEYFETVLKYMEEHNE